MIISFPIFGLLAFFFRKKSIEMSNEKCCCFILAFILYLFLCFVVIGEVFAMAMVPYFSEQAFFVLFSILKIICIVAQSCLIILEMNKQCLSFCERRVFFSWPSFRFVLHWLKDVVS